MLAIQVSMQILRWVLFKTYWAKNVWYHMHEKIEPRITIINEGYVYYDRLFVLHNVVYQIIFSV